MQALLVIILSSVAYVGARDGGVQDVGACDEGTCDTPGVLDANAVQSTGMLQVRRTFQQEQIITTEALQEQKLISRRSKAATGLVPEAWKYERDAGTCHTIPEAEDLWQCREFCSLFHDFPSDCNTLTASANTSMRCCEFVRSTTTEYKLIAKVPLSGEVLSKPAAADKAKRLMAKDLSKQLDFQLHLALLTDKSSLCTVAESWGVQDSLESCEEIARGNGAQFFAYGSTSEARECARAEDQPDACPDGRGADSFAFYELQLFPVPEAPVCEWTRHTRVYSGGYAAGDREKRSEEEAKARCVELGRDVCAAVTCQQPDSNRCSVRRSRDLRDSPSDTEYTLVASEDCYTDPSPGQGSESGLVEVPGHWVPYHFKAGQNGAWCNTAGRIKNFEYAYRNWKCGSAWCCVRGYGMVNLTDRSWDISLTTALEADVSSNASGAMLTITVTSENHEFGQTLQSSIRHLKAYPFGFVSQLLYSLNLTTEEEAKDQCKHITDSCACVGQDRCSWADGHCSVKDEGPECVFEQINGSLAGRTTNTDAALPLSLAKQKCTEESACRGLRCPDGRKCHLMREAMVHESLASDGLVHEEFFSLPGNGIDALTESDKFKNDAPDKVDLLQGTGGLEMRFGSHRGSRFTGTFWPRKTGKHYFWVVARDRAVFKINGTEIARCNWGLGKGNTGNHPEQMGTKDLEEGTPVQVELLSWGAGAWWANHVQLFSSMEVAGSVSNDKAPKAYNLGRDHGNMCLDTFGGRRDGAQLGLWACNSKNRNQRMVLLAHGTSEAPVYTVKTDSIRLCFNPEVNGKDQKFWVRSCYGKGTPMTANITDETNIKLVVGDKMLCCKRARNRCSFLPVDSPDSASCWKLSLKFPGDALPELTESMLVPLSQFKPNVQPASFLKDCRKRLSASCSECERQPQCPVSELQYELDTWCYKNTRYPLARKYLHNWRCYSDSELGLDFSINGLCTDSCGFPVLCPGGIRGSYEDKTRELERVIAERQQIPCANPLDHGATDLDEVYGSLLEAEALKPHQPIGAVKLQEYLDELCASLYRTSSSARLILNSTEEQRHWACVGGSGGTTGMCTSDCGHEVACLHDGGFQVLDHRPRLLLNAAHVGLKHFCKSKLSYVEESDVLVTFRLGRVDPGALRMDFESAQILEEVVAEAFADKAVVDRETVKVGLGLAVGNCVGFRGTQDCDADGERQPQLDQPCDEPILESTSGFCECIHGLQTAKVNCSHEDLDAVHMGTGSTCSDACDKLLAGSQQTTTTAAPNTPTIHVRTYQAEDAARFGVGGLTAREQELAQGHSECNWTVHPQKYSGGYAAGVSDSFTLEAAQAKCVELGAPTGSCKAVTCRGDSCTVRRSASLVNYNPEVTYVPSAACFQDLHKPEVKGGKFYKGFTGSGFVAFETTKGDAIQWNVHVEAAGKYIIFIRYSYFATQDWYRMKAMTLRVNGKSVTDEWYFTATSNWADWQRIPLVVSLQAGSNTVALIRGNSYMDPAGPYVDALIVTTFLGATEWTCMKGGSKSQLARITENGDVQVQSRDGKHIIWGDCPNLLQNPVPEAELQPLACGKNHSRVWGWWQWGWESQRHWCWKIRKGLFAVAGSEDVDGVDVRVVLHTANPTQGFNIMRRVQVVYGDDVLGHAIEQEIQSLPTVASFTTGDVVVADLLAQQGTKPTQPSLSKTAMHDAYWNTTGQIVHWPCGHSCEEPSGRYVEAWGIGPLPVPGGEFFYGEKHYHHIRGSEKLKWVLHSPLSAGQEWSFHARIMFENRGNKRGSFVLWSPDGQENYIEFDIIDSVSNDLLGERQAAMFVSGQRFWSPPNAVVTKAPENQEWHDVSIVKRDCTITVFVDGKEALANIPQYWKVSAVGFWPRGSGMRLLTFGMTGKGAEPHKDDLTPFCKMYLDNLVGFRVMRKGQSGCLKVTGASSPVQTTMNMKECTYFYFHESSMRDSSTGRCLDWFRGRKTYGLWSCHGGWNQRFGPYRAVEGKYEFMRFCLGHFDCLDELDLEICPKLQSACECSEYPKICGWNSTGGFCTSERKDEGVSCSACGRQPKCAPERYGALQTLADAWCRNNTDKQFARLQYRAHYLTQRWGCFSQTGLPVDRDGMCMDHCGYPVQCPAGPMPHDIESVDVHERMLDEVLYPNVLQTCDDPNRFSKEICAELGWGPGKGREEVCASARGPLNRWHCGGNMNFSEAQRTCNEMGARLCTKTELAHKEAILAGCALQKSRVWAKRSDCPEGAHMAMPGAPEYVQHFPPQCLQEGALNATAAVVCCADTEKPYVHTHPEVLAERKPPTPLTITSAVWAVYFDAGEHKMCLRLQRGTLIAQSCGNRQTLFASKDGQLHPWEESWKTPLRTHLCLEAGEESVRSTTCTLGAGDRLTLTDAGKLYVGDSGNQNSSCLSYDVHSSRMSSILLESDESQCGVWKFIFKHRISTPQIPVEVKNLIETTTFDETTAAAVVSAAIEQVKEEAGDAVSGTFWTWLDTVPGLRLSLASTSFPIHLGTVTNFYRLWLYFGADWKDSMSMMALATAYRGRDRNVLENDFTGFRMNGLGIYQSCGCDHDECTFPGHRGHLPKGGELLEYYLGQEANPNVTMDLPLFEGTGGAPWALMETWRPVPLDECVFHNLNGYSPGEYTFRYERHEIKCKTSDWHPGSGPRIAEDGGVCGRLSYLSSVGNTCGKSAPSRGVGQPGHAAGIRFAKVDKTYKSQHFWFIYDERVSTSSWNLALTENMWGQHGRHGHQAHGRSANVQWHKTVAATLSLDNGAARWEMGRLAAMVALQTSYWHDSDATSWMEQALAVDPYSVEVWEYFRVRIEQGKYDLVRAEGLWEDFQQKLITDSHEAFHALAERFFFTVADARTCDADKLAWLVSETNQVFDTWRTAGYGFDIEAAEAIWKVKQMECFVVLNNFSALLAHEEYGQLMRDLLSEEVGKETLNLKGPPYKSGLGACLAVIEAFLESEEDSEKRMEAIDWIIGETRVGEMMWDLFGKSYFYWIQYERVRPAPETLFDWVTAKLAQLGEDSRLASFQEWQESCMTKPWDHQHPNSRGAVYDGCYVGKNGDISQVDKFMAWIIPFHASNWTEDSCFPEWALEKLRQGGAALLQRGLNGTNQTHMDDGQFFRDCLRDFETASHNMTSVSPACQTFVKQLTTDDEDGHATADEREYFDEYVDDEQDETLAESEKSEWTAESLEDLPQWEQDKFRAAVPGLS